MKKLIFLLLILSSVNADVFELKGKTDFPVPKNNTKWYETEKYNYTVDWCIDGYVWKEFNRGLGRFSRLSLVQVFENKTITIGDKNITIAVVKTCGGKK